MTTQARVPFVTLKMSMKGYNDDLTPSDAFDRVVLLVEFDEAGYDHTCIAVQGLVDGFPSMVAGDEVQVEFIHARPDNSATFAGVMPRRAGERNWPEWSDFVDAVRYGTR